MSTKKPSDTKANQNLAVYVAGKWGDRQIIGATIRDVVEPRGLKVTFNWTQVEQDHNTTADVLQKYAENDLDGVRRADALIVLLTDPRYEYRGTCTEMGAALALRKPVWIVNPFPCDQPCGFLESIFVHCHNVFVVDGVEKAIEGVQQFFSYIVV